MSDQDACHSWASRTCSPSAGASRSNTFNSAGMASTAILWPAAASFSTSFPTRLPYAVKLIGAQLHLDLAIARAVVHGLPLLAVRLVQPPARAIVVRP